MIEHGLVDARRFAAFRHETSGDHADGWQFNWPPGTRRTTLSATPGGGTCFILEFPPGYRRPAERANTERGEPRFEWHSCHEEIFCLTGEIRFGDHYALAAPGYLNHPPGWVHPADQHTSTGCALLIRNSGPVDFHYETIPGGWDGREYVSTGCDTADPGATGITTRPIDTPAPAAVDPATGPVTSTLYEWPDGLITQVVTLPAGWRGTSGTGAAAVGHEMVFLLDGDLAVGDVPLHRWGYSSHRPGPRSGLVTDGGARLIRWTLR